MTAPQQRAEGSTESPAARSKIACSACRFNKVRCIRDDGEVLPCNRCKRYRLDCVLPPATKRRGRPPGSLSSTTKHGRNAAQASSSSYSHQASGSFSSEPYPPPHHPYLRAPTAQTPSSGTGISTVLLSPTSQTLAYPTASILPNHPITSPNAKTGAGANPNLDVSDYLDPGDRVFRTNASTPKVPFFQNHPARHSSDVRTVLSDEEPFGSIQAEGDDPIALKILSASEASYLISLYHERLNLLCAVLDMQLHNLQYLRSTSTLLLTAVLSASSKFFRKDLHPWLLSHAQTLLNRAICTGVVNLGTIQALQLLVYFKSPDDTSAWFKIGMAIRWGYQLYMHVQRRTPLPADHHAARRIVSAERAWYLLYCFDRGYSQTFGLPTTIRLDHIGDCESWAREHTYLGDTPDMHLACSIELCKIKDHWLTIFESNMPTSRDFMEATIDTVSAELDVLWRKWFAPESALPCWETSKELGVAWSVLDFMLIVRRHSLELAPDNALRRHGCLEVAGRIVDNMEKLSASGGLSFLQDTASTMTSSLGVLLRKLFRSANQSQKALIVNLLQRIHVSHTRIMGEEQNTAPYYVARFIRRLLGAINDENLAESRAPSPGPGVMNNHLDNPTLAAQEPMPTFMEDLNTFMQLSEPAAQDEGDDTQFWAQLLSAGPAVPENSGSMLFNDLMLDWGVSNDGLGL